MIILLVLPELLSSFEALFGAICPLFNLIENATDAGRALSADREYIREVFSHVPLVRAEHAN
jgi:hypothetical protein